MLMLAFLIGVFEFVALIILIVATVGTKGKIERMYFFLEEDNKRLEERINYLYLEINKLNKSDKEN